MIKNNIIQRYMNLPKFLYLLQYNSLFLPKMSIFSDQLEGGLTAIDFFENSNDPAFFDIAMNMWPIANETSEARTERLNEVENNTKEINSRKFSTPFGSYPKNDLEDIFPKCREWIYVSCWYHSSHECSAMWTLYGADKNSICIFTTIDKLKAQMESENDIDTLIVKEVNYLDHSSAKFKSNTLDPFISKALPFSFEKEIRVIGYNSNTDLSSLDKNSNNGIKIKIKSLAELIDKVVVSPEADSWFLDSVQKLCHDFNLRIEVQNSSLSKKRIETFFDSFNSIQNI